MGTVHRFPPHGHVRISSADCFDPILARESKVISGSPRSRASRAKDNQCAAGIPRARQTLTVDGASDRDEASLLVPPSESMTVSGVIMDGTIVCTVQTCQEFAPRKTTFGAECAAITGMIDPPDVIGNRLEALRKELKIRTQDQFAEKIGIDKSTYSSMKRGKRNLSFETACRIRSQWGVSIDWLFFGDLHQSGMQVMAKIGRGDSSDGKAPSRRKVS